MSNINKDITAALSVNFDAAEQQAIINAINLSLYDAPSSKAGLQHMGLYLPGGWYSLARAARSAYSTVSGVAGRLDLAPYVPGKRLVITDFSVNVVVNAAGQDVQFLVYDDTGPNGFPGNLVFKSGDAGLDATGLTQITANNLVLEQGELYWIGLQYSGTGTISAHTNVDMISLGAMPDGSGDYVCVRRAGTFNAPPTTFGFTSADLAAVASFPAVRFKLQA